MSSRKKKSESDAGGLPHIDGDRYQITKILGQGRVSHIYLAVDSLTQTQVAIKIFNAEHVPGEKSLAYLEEQLGRRANLSHPNITKIFSVGRYKNQLAPIVPYLVTEFAGGLTLEERIAGLKERPLTLRDSLSLLWQIASALTYLHAHKIAMNNLNPRHILLTDSGQVKLPPYGFASSSEWLREGPVLARVSGVDYRYVAPEMIAEVGITPGIPASDVYLFGVLAFELLCGVVPFDSVRQTLIQLHRTGPVPELIDDVGLPKWCVQLVASCLGKNPHDRPSAAEIKKQLHDHLSAADENLETIPRIQQGNEIRVLFVEDNRLDQLFLARFAVAERYPFRYKTANSISRAKQMLKSRVFDVVVSDYMLPDGTALDLLTKEGAPVIVVTGSDSNAVSSTVLDAGAYDCIAKSSDYQHLKMIPRLVAHAFELCRSEKEKMLLEERIKELEIFCQQKSEGSEG